MADRHLKLFHSYDNAKIEDNVTRALVIALSQLSPVHQRLVLRDLFLPHGSWEEKKNRIELVQREALKFDLQVHAAKESGSEGDDPLTSDDGVLVGLHHSIEEVDIDPEELEGSEGAARVDALVEDPANDLTAVIEVKLGASFSTSQLARHHRRFFDVEEASFDEVFRAVTWTDLVGYLDELAKQSVSGRERYVLEEFVEFANMIGLAPFLGFESADFNEENVQALQRFVSALERNVDVNPSFTAHGKAKRLDFEGVDPNLWVEYRDGSLELGLVCGVEKKKYARQYRDLLVDQTEGAREIFGELAQKAGELDDRIDLVIHPRARFFGTRVQVKTNRAARTYSLPDELPAVSELFADEDLNPIERITRKEITDRFGPWLEGREESFGPDGLFMPWPDLDEKGVLTSLYFHLGYQIPSDLLISKDRDATLEYVTPLLQALASAAQSLSSLRKQ